MTIEFQNCLEEARIRCGQLNAEAKTKGEGPFEVRVHSIYYCKVTDAIAGSYLSLIHRFGTREEAEAYAYKVETESWGEESAEVFPPREPPLKTVEELFPDDEDEIPF